MASWLRQEDEERSLDELDWWRPERVAARLGEDARWGSLGYIVVDELEQGVAGLVVSPWPRVDERGRLHFGDEDDSTHVTVEVRAFHKLLAAHREPIVSEDVDDATRDELRERDLAIGDVFAARLAKRFGRSPVDPKRWIRSREILDITSIARSVAKGQTAAALAGILHDDDEEG